VTPAAASLSLLAFLLAANEPPRVELETRSCALPGSRPIVCAQALDDRGVARVRAVFRAAGTRDFWSTEMRFDGARYCAWLPRPLPRTKAIEYYAEAFDDDFEISRTRTEVLDLHAGCAEEAVTTSGPTVVAPTTARQPELPPGFDGASVAARTASPPSSRRR
jgi:hypothetical protein